MRGSSRYCFIWRFSGTRSAEDVEEVSVSPMRKEIAEHYRHSKEAERLFNEWGELERFRTQVILARHLPAVPSAIFDVGGGAGVYAFPLAQQGYAVHLIDAMERHVEQARARAVASGVILASIRQGDARRLDVPSNEADAVLLLGPLYHLIEASDRRQALAEAFRILRPGGILFAAGISRFASLIDGLSRGFFRDPEFRKIIAEDLTSGLHRNPTANLEYFTTAYFHRPEELSNEVRETGFCNVKTLAIEGPAWSAAHFQEAWNDTVQRQELLQFLLLIESEPSALGASGHLMAVARRPG